MRVSRPSEERARELTPSPAGELHAEAEESAEAPPLLASGPSPVPLGHLSYSALDSYKRCGYRFYVERVLGVRAGLVTPAPNAGDETAVPALALGNAVHLALEWSGRAGWERPGDERLNALLTQEGLAGNSDAATRARRLTDGWLDSELCREIADLPSKPEAPFVLPLGGTVLRGKIDLLAHDVEEVTVIDFKTDRVGSSDVAQIAKRYVAQRYVYALATAGLRPGRPVRTAYVFLERPDEPVVEVFDNAALARAKASLEGLIAQIRSGAFEPTHEPYASLCFGCPAAPRLCPRPAWRPSKEAPAAVR